MELIKTYIGYVMGILGFAGIIWTYATRSADKKYDVVDLKKDVIELRTNMVTQQDVKNVVNTALFTQLAPVIQNQNALRSSYILHLYDSKISIDNFTKYLNGIQFELNIPRESDTLKVKITKINKDGQK